jgi:hypothetical protein
MDSVRWVQDSSLNDWNLWNMNGSLSYYWWRASHQPTLLKTYYSPEKK